ncbi:MAG TPA: class I SAM-dependent methyltransferase [Nocardioidaceae bacterium]|nr:class I SAM-dependent methyltransferase [Nocardioidaceae bacterium]
MPEMPEPPHPAEPGSPEYAARALSFAGVADAYDRARPGYPAEAAEWLTGGSGEPSRRRARVVELGAGTGKLTEALLALGHDVLATDPLEAMLQHLHARCPEVPAVRASAEAIPAPSRSADVVVAGQAFHWFDHARALPEIARVLRPGGHLALAWNLRDERIPWVRRLGEMIGPDNSTEREVDPSRVLVGSGLFGYVETAAFRFWQPLDRAKLRDLIASRSNIATMAETERAQVLEKADALYAEYGRGADGMLLPYVTRCFRAAVRPQPPEHPGPEDPEPLLIDF